MAADGAAARRIISILLAWYDNNKRAFPFRGTKEPYRVWLSEIMLQQTRTETVGPYYERFLARFPDVFTLAKAEEQQVLKAWEGLGYYTRAHNLHRAARMVAEEYQGVFPSTSAELRRLPGVGPYAAAAIASIRCPPWTATSTASSAACSWWRRTSASPPSSDACMLWGFR